MKKFKMPTSYTVVFFALLVATVLSYFVPQSHFDSETGKIIVNSVVDANGNILEGQGLIQFGLFDVLMSIVHGFESSSNVSVGILCAGGFLAVLNHVEALEAAIISLLNKFKGNVLIALMMLVFAILGTTFGFWEEITAFAVVIIPMFVLAGYDIMTGLAILFIGATIGNMASLVNPFSVGAAVAAIGNPDLTIGSGIILRSIIFVVLYLIGTFMVIQYASKVKDDPKKSIIYDLEDKNNLMDVEATPPEFTGKRKASAYVLVAVIILIVLGNFPWERLLGESAMNAVNAPITFLAGIPVLGDLLGAGHFTLLGDWGFSEFAFTFLLGAFVLKFINKIPEREFMHVFMDGMKDLMGVVVVLAISRGIATMVGTSTQGMSVTFIYWLSSALEGVPLWVFGIMAVLVYALIGIFLQSTSGVAGLSMPILGTVAAALFLGTAIGEVGGQILLISAFVAGVNFLSSFYPGAVIMGTLDLVNVPYDRYLKFAMKTLCMLLFAAALIIAIAPYIGIVS